MQKNIFSCKFALNFYHLFIMNNNGNKANDDFDKVYDAWLEDISFCVKEPAAIYLTKNDFDNPSRRFSYADYLRIPESNRIMEILNGILSLFAAPATIHAHITTNLSYHFVSFVKKKKGKCRVFHNPFSVRLSLDGATDNEKIFNVVQPDICVICNPLKIDSQGCFGPPDLIVEVLSPSHRKRDLIEKFNLYEASGVKEYWIVDPKAKTVNVYLLQPDGQYNSGTVYVCNQKVPVHIFKGLEIDLNELFEQ